MPQLSAELKRFEHLKGAFEIIRYLGEQDQPADEYLICDDLDMSERRFGKAIKRIVTRDFVKMNADREYYLTQKGEDAAIELDEYFADGGRQKNTGSNKVNRKLLVALPRELGAGQTTDMYIGFEPDNASSFSSPADIVLRVSAANALLSGSDDEMLKLHNDSLTQTLQLTPEMFTQVRVKVQVFQLAPNGEDITMCGGLYVDVNVSPDQAHDGFVAYSSQIALDPT